ncbi:hypothetical protein BKA62DRAFT_683625 [Auriculariales sp. MPI-PUGE-AT-0066]|nr:hypothetical protein BKA62DRAFT_683625 [Auriculariales sp. MPI-PUGE-AT-0066]
MASPEPELSPSAGLLSALNGVICSEGIFDIDLLLRSFPTYGPWFIQVAFGSREDYESVSTARLKERKAIPWLLVHSRGDTLVDLAQAQVMQESLITLRGGDSTKVETEWEFEDEHDDVLKNPQFVQAVASFVKRYTI